MATTTELQAMRLAISLSAFGSGTTSPNPPVGCVILSRYGNIVGTGFHRRKGQSHAEAFALNEAKDDARGGTAVVTLEPCNHLGRTPPCRQALIDAGVSRVLIALMDPTSREEGGAARLLRAGVEVETDVLSDEARLILGPWISTHRRQRPYIHLLLTEDHDQLPHQEATTGYDAVHWPDGTITEGTTGAHPPEEFSLPNSIDLNATNNTLHILHNTGVRTLLVINPDNPGAFTKDRLADRITIYGDSNLPLDATIMSLFSNYSLQAIQRHSRRFLKIDLGGAEDK